MRWSWQLSGLLAAVALSLAAGEVELEAFPTTEFESYTGDEQDVKVAFTMKAPEMAAASAPLSLTIVLDRSGSMHGKKMDLVKATSKFLVDKLAEEDGKHQTGIVLYGDDVVELVELQPVTKESAPLMKTSIDSVFAYGQNSLSGGLKRGVEQQISGPEDAIRSVFLFTDGLPNIGNTTTEDILIELEDTLYGGEDSDDEEGGAPITVSTFAVGADIDRTLMKGIATSGGGQAYFIPSAQEIPIAFGDALGGLLSTVAEDVTVDFRRMNGAFIYKRPLFTKGIRTLYDHIEAEYGTSVFFGNLYAEERRDVVIELGVPEDVPDILEVVLEYTDVTNLEIVTKNFTVTLSRDAKKAGDQEPQPLVDLADTKFFIARAVLEAYEFIERGNPIGTARKIGEAEELLKAYPIKDEPSLVAVQKDLDGIMKLLGSLAIAQAQLAADSGRAPASGRAIETAAAVVEVFPGSDDPEVLAIQKGIEEVEMLLDSGAVQAVTMARIHARKGNTTATAEAIENATAIVESYPDKDDPAIARVQKDIKDISKLLEDGAIEEGGDVPLDTIPPPPAFDPNGTLERVIGTLVEALYMQRSSVATAEDAVLATTMDTDTAAKVEMRMEAAEAVLSGMGAGDSGAKAPKKSRKDGPKGPAEIQALTAKGELVAVPMSPPAKGSKGSGLPADVEKAIKSG